MQQYLAVHDWEKHQSYRNDRGTPPWIKVHRSLMTSPKWARLTDAEKGQLISIWIVAADKNGVVPADPFVLRKVCQLDDNPNIEKFKEIGLLEECDTIPTPKRRQVDAKLTPKRRQVDAPEAEAEADKKIINNKKMTKPSLYETPTGCHLKDILENGRLPRGWLAVSKVSSRLSDAELERLEVRFIAHHTTGKGNDFKRDGVGGWNDCWQQGWVRKEKQ